MLFCSKMALRVLLNSDMIFDLWDVHLTLISDDLEYLPVACYDAIK